MIVEDSEVAVKKFKMFADKANNEAQVLDLCKKYLKHKGIDVDNAAAMNAALSSQIAPPRIETRYVGAGDLVEAHGEYAIDDYAIRSLKDDFEAQIHAKKYVSQLIMQEVIKNDAVKFEQYKDYSRAQLIVRGSLLVYKGNRK